MRPIRTIGYCRVSSQVQESQGTSLDVQREEIVRWCVFRGYPEPTIHVETESGSLEKEEARRVQQALMDAARPGDLIIVSKQDRWSRDVVHMLKSVRKLLAIGADFFAIAEGFEPSTSSGNFTMTVMAAVAEQERARIRERSRGAILRLRMLGKVTQSTPPLGYLRDPETRLYVADPEWAPKVAEMFALSATCPLKEVTRLLEIDGVRIPGRDPANMARRLRNRMYLGETVLPSGETLVTHPPLVDVDTFNRAQEALKERSMGGRPVDRSKGSLFLLRGVVRCARCKHVAHSDPGNGTTQAYYRCYYPAPVCGAKLLARRDEVDAQFERLVGERLEDLAEQLSRAPKKSRAVVDFAAAKSRIMAKRARVVDAIADGVLKHVEARAKLVECDDELRRIEADESAAKPATPADRREKLAQIETVRQAWAGMSIEAKRDVVRRLTKLVTLSRTAGPRWTRSRWDLQVEWRECANQCA